MIHPNDHYDLTFATELNGQVFFPIQDSRSNICALQKPDGSLAEWTRYAAFGSKTIKSDLQEIYNPWRFANRREVVNLSLFTHRFYNSHLMRWQTTDPLGFQDGLNLYCYVHNNPFCYKDPDGRFAFAFTIPVFQATFGAVLTTAFLPAIGTTLAVAAVGYSCYQLGVYVNSQINDAEIPAEVEQPTKKEDRREKFKFPKNPDDLLPDLPRDDKGRIHPADNIRIRPEKHEMLPGKTHNSRHHDQHYHVETRRDPTQSWNKKSNVRKIEPNGYSIGEGTGFLPGEIFPGMIL